MVEKFINYLENNYDLNDLTKEMVSYNSLSLCILDCVYSLRAQYYSTTVPVVKRYADTFLNGNLLYDSETLEKFISNINQCGGIENFASNILKNKQKLAGNLKSFICYELARKLLLLGINNLENFRNFSSTEILEIVISSVKGIGNAGMNYLFMLAGDPSRCKPDVHIHHCMKDALGFDVSDKECQDILTESANFLNKKYPNLTVKMLDNLIWGKYQIGQLKK